MKKFLLTTLGIFLLLALSAIANAAELYGQFSASDPAILRGAVIIVQCDEWQRSVSISKHGKYSVRGVPGNRGCFFTIQHPNFRESAKVGFSTNRSVVTLNAELRIRDNRILVLRR
jgi:hypothetical protein